MPTKTNPNAGKPGYDKYGVKLMAQRKKEEQAEKNKKQFIESRNARDKKIKDDAARKAQVEKIKKTMGLSEPSSSVPKSSTPKSSTPKTKNQEREALAIKERGIQLSATNIKPFSNGTLAARASASNENKKKLDKLQKISDRVDRRQDRKDNRAERLAARKDITFDEAKNLQESRKLARKDFLRSFASNLAGVEMGKQGGNFNTKDIDFFNNQNAKSDAAQAQETEIENNEEMYKSKLSAKSRTNDSLGDVGFSNINN